MADNSWSDEDIMIKISLALGRIPLLRLFYYSLIFELYNDRRN